MIERLSLRDHSLIAGRAESIQRFAFALDYCRGCTVLDAGCGSGYGAHFLAASGAASVLAGDVSSAAIAEATATYRHENLRFEQLDIQQLDVPALRDRFDVIISFETLAHLPAPDDFLRGAKSALRAGGVLIVSTPNGELVKTDASGRPLYRYQHRAYGRSAFLACLGAHFTEVRLYGQWLTHQGTLRKTRARELFAQLYDAYYNPSARLGRVLKRLAGRTVAPPPIFFGEADSYEGDFCIAPLEHGTFPWPPTTLLAVCRD